MFQPQQTNRLALGVQVLLHFRSITTVDMATCAPLSVISRLVCLFHSASWDTELWFNSDRLIGTSPTRYSWHDPKHKQAYELAGYLPHRLAFAWRHCDFVHHCSAPLLSSKDGLCISQPEITLCKHRGNVRRVCITRHGVHLSLHYYCGHQ